MLGFVTARGVRALGGWCQLEGREIPLSPPLEEGEVDRASVASIAYVKHIGPLNSKHFPLS